MVKRHHCSRSPPSKQVFNLSFETKLQSLSHTLCDRWLFGILLTLPSGSSCSTVALQPDAAGTTVEFSLRGADSELLGPSFQYEVIQVFGVDGRAVALRPSHAPQTLVLAFRGTRVDHSAAAASPANKASSAPARGRAAPQSEDVKALLNTSMVDAKWLPDALMRVHAGVLGHHNDLWDTSARPCATSPGGLGQFIAQTVLPHPPTNILFVGLSLGAALAQISALRLAAEHPHLAARSAVFGLGALQFANAAVAAHFRQVFGARAAQLVTTRRRIGKPPTNATWWVHDTSTEAAAELEARIAAATAAAAVGLYRGSSGGGPQLRGWQLLRPPADGREGPALCAGRAESAAEERGSLASRVSAAERMITANAAAWLVADPITAAFSDETVPMHHVFTIPAGASGLGAAGGGGGNQEVEADVHLPLRPLPARPGGLTAQPAALAALMTGRIAAQHIMRLDYLSLHLSRHYRAGLRGAHLAYRSGRATGHGAGLQALPSLDRVSSAGGMKRGRLPTAGSLDTMQPPLMRIATSWPEEDEEELFGYGPPVPAPVGEKVSLARRRSSAVGRPEMGAPVPPAVVAAQPLANQTEATRAKGLTILNVAAAAAGSSQSFDSAASDDIGAVSTDEPGGLRRSARIEGLLKSVLRVGWGARLAHRMHKEAHLMCSLDRQFSDLISQQPPALPQAAASTAQGQPVAPALLRDAGSARQSLRGLPPRPSEDLSYWGF